MKDELERRLAATDFSADSRVRASLRARLLSRRAASRFPSRVAFAAAFAAAALLVLFFPRSKPQAPAPAAVAESEARPAPAPTAAARGSRYPRGANGLPVLPGVLVASAEAEPSPLSSRSVDRVIDLRPGVLVREKDASAVVWEMDGARYRLETRRITLQYLFETRRL